MDSEQDTQQIDDTPQEETLANVSTLEPSASGNASQSVGTTLQDHRRSTQGLRSDALSLPSTQLSQLSLGSERSPAATRRGDIRPSGALDRYLASDLRSEVRPTSPAAMSSRGDGGLGVAPVIWGTTVNIEDSMAMFRNFLNNYAEDEIEDPFYPSYLAHVIENVNP